MDSALDVHRLHFAFTITYHYLFPQLTMGLAPLLVFFKWRALRTGEEKYDRAARFWGRLFALNFLFGVVTGVPMEFQFGTNWARFSHRTGGVIATSLAMEGVFSFFLESAFLGLFLFGEKRFSRKMQLFFVFMLWFGSWLSGFFIITAHAWMQHPVGYEIATDGTFHLTSFWSLLFNRWALWEYPHVMGGAVVTGGFVMASVGAFHLLSKRHEEQGRLFVATGVIAAAIAAFLQLWPTGDGQGQMVAEHQPVTLAAMEGLFHSESGASMVLIGQPNMETHTIDNPIAIPKALSFLTHRRWEATVHGLNSFPRDQWPDNIPLLYYCYHIMVGLGTIFIGITALCLLLLWRKKLFTMRSMLWVLMLSFPFPFIANTAGWMTAELGRQPWIVHGLMRTADGYSHTVSAGNALFTLLGWMGLYALLSIIFTFLFWHEVRYGLDKKEASEMQNAK